jgi:xanthine dehydrogenase iron-sulfur cluster and FAD-binding subunit A
MSSKKETLPSEYLHKSEGLTGTKLVCGEGGCGACTVLVSAGDSSSEALHHKAVNSCLFLLADAHDAHVTTIEGVERREASSEGADGAEDGKKVCVDVGRKHKEPLANYSSLHPWQKGIIDAHGSQMH